MTPPDRATGASAEDGRFQRLSAAALDEALALHPDMATELGDHRFDDRLPDARPEALEEERRMLEARLRELEALEEPALLPENRVDAEILRAALRSRRYELEVLREHEWNPLVANPAGAVYTLLARDFAPLGERLRSLAGRLAAVPASLEVARRTLHDMPRVHLETAIGQFAGAAALIGQEVDAALEAEPALRSELDAARPATLEAIEDHRRWLTDRLESLDGPGPDPRIGPERFARKLAHTLDAAATADEILARAEAELLRIEEEIARTASRLEGGAGGPEVVRKVLDRLAEDRPDDTTILDLCRRALAGVTAFVREHNLVTVYDDPIEIIEMPEFNRGVAVAYCDPPGPLEEAPLPTFFAVSPTPEDWPPERVISFYREYNAHMVHNLTVHEAMPGHALQLAHSRRFHGPTRVRDALWSGPFVEGWAVYVERVAADHGYRGDALRMQQLKMQLRMVINAILDARVHAHGMTEGEAMRLMMERGHQEEGEATGKWRRAQLSSTQLSTYFVGYVEVSDLAADLRAANPGITDRALHDQLLSHGSPPPRHLRTLVGL
ncbi:MAG TPA: DUF885 domain-containing protein [Actinomycetes bacterium]|nr:DUF885 domain-containing protein [Actinomycetes bacterium]